MRLNVGLVTLSLGLFIGCSSLYPLEFGHGTKAPPSQASSKVTPSTVSGSSANQPTFKTFAIYTDRVPRHSHYAPSGYMGDSDLTLSGAFISTPNGREGPCVRVLYKADGPKGWSGIYWQDPANNWGDSPGRSGYDLRGAQTLSFWARGESGGERIHEFRMGGILGQYPDSDAAVLSNVKLTREWKKYSIDLRKKDLRHIIGGFGFSVLKAENPGGMTAYLDDIQYEGSENNFSSAAVSTAPLLGEAVVSSTASAVVISTPSTPAAMAVPAVQSKDMTVKQTEAGLRVSFSSQILFSSGKAVLAEGSHRVLDQLIELLAVYPTNRVLIEGHTDNTGNAAFNLKLSELRAEHIRDYLIKQGGYAEKRFQIVGYGATRPIADNASPAGRSLNRRVEVTILKNEK